MTGKPDKETRYEAAALRMMINGPSLLFRWFVNVQVLIDRYFFDKVQANYNASRETTYETSFDLLLIQLLILSLIVGRLIDQIIRRYFLDTLVASRLCLGQAGRVDGS